MKKLSDTQRFVLATAVGPGGEGRIRRMNVVTQGILVAAGLIEEGKRIRTETERNNLIEDQERHILKAKEVLLRDVDDWRMAHRQLTKAADIQHSLDATAYWITEKGRQAVAS